MSQGPHATSRRRFLGGIAGVAGALALHPASIGRAAAVPGRPLARDAAPAPSAVAEPALRHLAWVWQFAQDGEKDEIRRVLAEHRLGVALKTHDGTEWMSKYDRSADAVSGPKSVHELAQFFEDGGVPFHAWCVVNGEEPKREALMAAEVLSAGARSISLDLEAFAGFWRGTSQAAVEFGRELRRLSPAAWIATSTDSRPWEIDRIPLAEFSGFASEIAPQVYWSAFRTAANRRKFAAAGYAVGESGVTPRFVLDAAMDKLRPFGLPVRPIGDGTSDVESEWSEFIDRAYENNAEAVSVWRFGVTPSAVWRLLSANPPRPLSYVVQTGDSLSALAEQWRTTVGAITELNGISDANLIGVGQKLWVPRGVRVAPLPLTYSVEPGDTLSAIAERFDTTAGAIAELNGLSNANLLSIGQELQIPRTGFTQPALPSYLAYTVQSGDTLARIAARHDTSAAAIAELNGLANPNLLRVGQELRIERGAPAPQTERVYIVEPGDTLIAIAGRFDTTVDAITALNGIASANLIGIGQRLRIP